MKSPKPRRKCLTVEDLGFYVRSCFFPDEDGKRKRNPTWQEVVAMWDAGKKRRKP